MGNVGAEFARRLISLRDLSPPVEIEELAARYAKVTFERLPDRFSGIALWLKHSDRQAEIIVNSEMVEWRRRFTLAHELGHVIIPWHVGNIVDSNLDDFIEIADTEIEREADAFAAELLCPETFARRLLSEANNYAEAHEALALKAQISGRAAAFRIMELSDDCLVAEHSGGVVRWSMKGAGLAASRPFNQPIRDVAFSSASEESSCRIRTSSYRWWRFPEASPVETTNASWREILDEILLEYRPQEREKIKMSISGVFGAANSARVGSVGRLVQVVRERFDTRPELEKFAAHQRFMEFLSARATEIFSRR